jgi:hypothetical protein
LNPEKLIAITYLNLRIGIGKPFVS